MSAAAAADAAVAPPKKGKKKLFIIIGVVVALLAVAGGAAVFMLKKKAAAQAEEADGGEAEHAPKKATKHDAKHPPTFVPMDPFTVNLADRETERYLQVSLTLELGDAKVADQVKAFLPAIRNNILMVLAHRTSTELLEREGKTKLAKDIARETERALGIEPPEQGAEEDGKADKKSKGKKKSLPVERLVNQVHFGNFIIQ
jgi:flagellar protein FliL